MIKGMYSSSSSDWETPQEFFDLLDSEFHFTLDVCASFENHKCEKFFTVFEDGLSQDWKKNICWMNPPYGREIGKWLKKAVESMEQGACVVCLLPSRTDTKWWHEYVMKSATQIRFLKGRLKFGDSKNSSPFPSAVVIFDGREREKSQKWTVL